MCYTISACFPFEPLKKWMTFKDIFPGLSKTLAATSTTTATTGQPYYLRSLLHYYTPHRTLRSVNQRLLQQPRVSTEFGKFEFGSVTFHLKRGTVYPSN